MVILIKSDYSDLDSEFDRLESMPTLKMTAALDGVLDLGFQTARANVHVDTGRLKKSGKQASKTAKTLNKWEGMFSFGAPSEGVDYAIYEKERGGAHNFFNQVFLLKNLFRVALLKGLRR